MSVILTILKILGIILLIILGILFLTLLIVLSVPIRYQASGQLENGGKPEIKIRVTWLFPVVYFTAGYSENLTFAVRILGFLIYPKKTGSDCSDEKAELTSEVGEYETEEAKETDSLSAEKQDSVSSASAKSEELPSGILEKLEYYLDKFFDWLEQLKENAETAVSSAASKVEKLQAKITYYLDIITADDTKDFFEKVLNCLVKILRHIKPKKFSANLCIGTDDPAVTGNILAIHGMLYPWIGDNISIEADFEQKQAAGDFFLKGKIRLGALLYQALRILTDRRFYKLLRQLKKGGNN